MSLSENLPQTFSPLAGEPFRLLDLLVYPDRSVLVGPQGERHLEPKVMSLLVHLADQAPAVVPRNTLLDSVWAGVVVSDQVLTRCVSELRKVLGEKAGVPQYIETIPKRGYCLKHQPEALNEIAESPKLMLNLLRDDLDTVSVLPLQPLGEEEQGVMYGTGFSRDLTQLLSLVPGIRVAASSSVEHLSRGSHGPFEIAEMLGSRYVVSGSMEFRAGAFRMRIELVDVQTHRQLWSQRYDEQIGQFFEVQDQLSQRIARSLCSALAAGKVQDMASRAPFDPSVFERIQMAEDARRNYNRSAAEFIVENLEVALNLQPDNGVAHAFLAMQLAQNLVSGWSGDAAVTAQKASIHLREALRLSPNDSRVLMAAGIAALMRGEHQQAMLYLQDSLTKNPNEPHALAEYGTARFYVTKELAPSLALIQLAEDAAPQHPRFSIWAYRRGICHYEAGDYRAAVAAFDEGIARTPNYHHTYLTKALAWIALGNEAQAMQSILQGVGHAPGMVCETYLSGVASFGLTVSKDQALGFRRLWSEAQTSGLSRS